MARCECVPRRGLIPSRHRDKPITLQDRDIVAPVGGGVDATEAFTSPTVVFAQIKTIKGVMIFSGTQVGRSPSTHEMNIRFTTGITSGKTWVEFNGDNYKIIDVTNVNEDNDSLILTTILRGDAGIPVNAQ